LIKGDQPIAETRNADLRIRIGIGISIVT